MLRREASERAFQILNKAVERVRPFLKKASGNLGVRLPEVKIVAGFEAGGKPRRIALEAERGIIVLGANFVDLWLDNGLSEEFIEHLTMFSLFHELKHWEEVSKMTNLQRGEFYQQYSTDPKFHDIVESRQNSYAKQWMNKLGSPQERFREEYRMLGELLGVF